MLVPGREEIDVGVAARSPDRVEVEEVSDLASR